ncbi:hypothetical protein AB205_0130250 [Pelobates cultripes]|uniref:C3H1-type domain-containing protein n=1 Tax=Pelobates cultripes TaxID=61616 RepID=A0AAD1WTE8_PELCU|nr:hypothetical protein AB205_0130250 [Pelobates cultripes]
MEPAISSLGLLSGYNSSGSDEDNSTDKPSSHSSTAVNFFSSNASSSDEESEVQNKKEIPQNSVTVNSPLPTVRLPAPLLGRQVVAGPGGVFSSTFREEQEAQLNVLEQHVKLSDSNWMKRGRGVCLAYQKDGRCRYGTKCRYSHDSDLMQPGTQLVNKGSEHNLLREDGGWMHREENVEGNEGKESELDRDEKQSQRGKRKKPGLSNTLIPPKKSMQNYKEQLAAERPWDL